MAVVGGVAEATRTPDAVIAAGDTMVELTVEGEAMAGAAEIIMAVVAVTMGAADIMEVAAMAMAVSA
jgi:hypothetical protein